MTNLRQHEKFMRLALKLAGKANASPNPCVGAVVVKDGKVVGKGFHKKAGLPHAEVEALGSLQNKQDAAGATLYLTFEPCNHFGRTPPCTKAIIEAGIAKVIFALKDPNPKVAGGGEEELRKAGIVVEKGVLEAEARKVHEVFIKHATTGMPFVVLKAAMTLDGKTATRTGESKWITGEKARKFVHKLRSKYDAILVGIATVLADDPQLTARVRGGRDPLRVVIDPQLRIPLNAKVLKDGNFVVATTQITLGQNSSKKAELEKKGGKVIAVGVLENGEVDLRELLKKLSETGVASVLVEGGSETHGAFVDQKLFDKIIFFIAPKIVGGRSAKPIVGGEGKEKIGESIQLKGTSVKKIGEDFVFEAYPQW